MPGPEAKILLKEAEDRQYYDTRSILYLLALFIICEVVYLDTLTYTTSLPYLQFVS